MPHPNKRQILLGLEAGRKLHDLMREPGMPSKSLLDEWRDNDPEFEQQYLAAVEAGRVKRGEPKPAPVIVTRDGQEYVIPRSSALQRELEQEDLKVAQALDMLAHPSDGTSPVVTEPAEPEVPTLPALAEAVVVAPAAAEPPAKLSKSEALARARESKAAKRAAGETATARWVEVAAKAPELDEEAGRNLSKYVAYLESETRKGEKFKEYVHARLDAAGIAPHHEQNAIDGCRIGRRLDDLLLYEHQPQALGEEAPCPAEAVPAPLPQHPGLVLAALLDLAGVNRRSFAAALGVSYGSLSDVLRGRYNLSLEFCAALEQANWGTTETWARRQVNYLTHLRTTVAA